MKDGQKAQDWGCPHVIPWTFKKTQASKLSDAQGIPSSSSTTIRSSSLKLSFYHFTYYVLFLDLLCVFISVCFILFDGHYNVRSYHPCLGERQAPIFITILLCFAYILQSILSCCLFASKLSLLAFILFRAAGCLLLNSLVLHFYLLESCFG